MKRGLYWAAYREGRADRFFPLGLLRSKAQILIFMGEWEPAERIYRLVLEAMSRADDREEEARTLFDLSGLMYFRSENRVGYELAEKAEAIFDEIGDVHGRIKVLGIMGSIHGAWSDYQKALEYDRRMKELAEANGYQELTADALRKIGVSHFWLGETGQALEYLEKSRQLAERLNNPQFLGGVIHAIGLTHRERKEFSIARPILEEALSIFTRTGDQRSIGMTLGSLAGLHYYLQEYDQALELYRRQERIAEKMGDKYFLSCVYGDISAIYMDMGMFDQGREMAARELALAQEAEDKLSIGDAHYRLGLIAELEGDDTTAARHFEAAVDFGRQVKSGRFLPDYLIAQAKQLYRTGQQSRVMGILAEAREIAGGFAREDILTQCRILDLLISFSNAPELTEKQLVDLAEEQPEDSNNRGDIFFQLWKCTGKDEHRLKALAIYKKLSGDKSNSFYQKAVRELEG